MEHFWVVVSRVEAIQGEEEAGTDDHPEPHCECVDKACSTIGVHDCQWDQGDQIFFTKCVLYLASNSQDSSETNPQSRLEFFS